MLAPNYQSGRDQIAGFKRLYKGSVAGEVYTQLNQPDYSAELAQLQAAAPDVVYVFYPGGMGVNFIKQYKQAGLLGKIPLVSASTVDGTTLPALKDTALGAVTGTFWGLISTTRPARISSPRSRKVQPHPLAVRGAGLRLGAADRQRAEEDRRQDRGQAGLPQRRCAPLTTRRCAGPTSSTSTATRSRTSTSSRWPRTAPAASRSRPSPRR
jgi:hypothetical protein